VNLEKVYNALKLSEHEILPSAFEKLSTLKILYSDNSDHYTSIETCLNSHNELVHSILEFKDSTNCRPVGLNFHCNKAIADHYG
jgi:hypothetical protein